MKPSSAVAIALSFAAPLFTSSGLAQDPKTPPANPAPSQPGTTVVPGQFVIEAGEVALPALIDRAATYLGRNILTDARELAAGSPAKSVLRLQQRIVTDRCGCEEMLASVLQTHGLALTWADQKAGIMEVLNMSGPRSREVTQRAQARSVDEVLAQPNLKLPVTVTVPLQHINATIATNALRPFFASIGGPQGGATLTLGNVGSSGAMVMNGMQDQVAAAIQMLQKVDQPPKAPTEETLDLRRQLKALEARLKALEEKIGIGTGAK
jgi:hypothetical protein